MKFIKILFIALLCGFVTFFAFRWISLELIKLFGGDTQTYSIIIFIFCLLGFIISLIRTIYLSRQPYSKDKWTKTLQWVFIYIFIIVGLYPYLEEEYNTVPIYNEEYGVIQEWNNGFRIISKSGNELVPRGFYDGVMQVFVKNTGRDCFLTIKEDYSSGHFIVKVYDEGEIISHYNLEVSYEKEDDDEYYKMDQFIKVRIGQITYEFITPYDALENAYVIDFSSNKYDSSQSAKKRDSKKSDLEEEETHERHNTNVSSSSNTYEPEYATRDEWIPCFACNGTGNCSACKGRGEYPVTDAYGSVIDIVKCTVCYGNGRCQTCYGTRGQYEKRTYQVR